MSETQEVVIDEKSNMNNNFMEMMENVPPYVLPVAVAVVVVLTIVAVYAAFVQKKKKQDQTSETSVSTNTVGLEDFAYIVKQLRPNSSHLDVLWAIASTPEAIAWGLRAYDAQQKLRDERSAEEAKSNGSKSKASSASTDLFELDDGGWDEGDDEELDEEEKRRAKLAAEAEEKKKSDREQLKKATGQVKVLLEGFDEGVIGQRWVEKTLASKGAWPPKDLGTLKDATYTYKGKKVEALEHPGLRRNLCMIMGRLHASMLNSHTELLEAGSKQLIDQTYFKGSLEFRGRCAMLLEAALRSAVACRSFSLASTIVETVAMFKIGCYHDETEWFDGVMKKTYETPPELEIKHTVLETPGEAEIVTEDNVSLQLEVTRLHAEAFTKQKIAMFQKQGIPPQIALQTYREGWWFFVKAERMEGQGDLSNALELKTDGVLQNVKSSDLDDFHAAAFEDRLVIAWPMIVQNVAQKEGKVKIQFNAPPLPGKYKFTVAVKSQDFLGADQEFEMDATILDAASVERKVKEPELLSTEDDKDASDDDKKEK